MYICIPMDGLKEFMTDKMQDAEYMEKHFRRTRDGVGNLCVPIEEILSITGTKMEIPVEVKADGNHILMTPTKSRLEESTHAQNPI